ncbi:MAG: hypothetical protein PVH29_03005 [Candidatus Zixiibacteriota bacterium]|jgi:DNA-binding beta-propeller fold protein YncE
MKLLIATLVLLFIGAAYADVWIGVDGGLRHYSYDGEYIRSFDSYRRPISLVLDAERNRLWFLDAYDYKLVCFDVEEKRELLSVPKVAHAPAIAAGDLRIYMLEKRPFEPSISVDPSDGSVWIADFYGHEVARIDLDGNEIFRSASFHEPFSIATLGDCNAWVSGRIRTLTLISPTCETLNNLSGVNEARALAYDAAQDLVWVADYRNNRVFAINREGRLKKRIPGVELPEKLAVDEERSTVWVATNYNGIIKISSDKEEITATIPEPDSVVALDIDSEGRLWVAYDKAEEVTCYSPEAEDVVTIRRVKGVVGIAAE